MKNALILTIMLCCVTLTQAQWNRDAVKAKGPLVEKTLDLDRFDSFDLAISGDVILRRGDRQEVVVSAPENVIDLFDTRVKDGNWEIRFTKNVNSYYQQITVAITLPELKGVYVSGSGDVENRDEWTTKGKVRLGVSGSGNIAMNMNADEIDVRVSGSGDITLRGQADHLNASVSGSGDIDASKFRVRTCDASTVGSGDIEVYVSEQLNAKVVGSGDVEYAGNPDVRKNIIGSGDISRM